MKPKILITLDTCTLERRGVPFDGVNLKAAYVRSVEKAGGLPLLVAPTTDGPVIQDLGELMDGLVITGGFFDIDPSLYGESADGKRVDAPNHLRTGFEQGLLNAALRRNTPVLGVCGGMQLINVMLGGTLLKDINTEIENAHEHEQPTSPAIADHPVVLSEDSRLAAALGRTRIEVNTTHHQAIARLGEDLLATGTAPDGVIEVIEHATRPDIVGVQWHPELLDDDVSRHLYRQLVEQAANRA